MQARSSAYLRAVARLALSATIVVIPFRYRFLLSARPLPPIYKDYTDVLLFISDVFLMATLVLWLLSLALEPRRLTIKPFFLSLPLAGVTGMGIVSIAISVDPLLSAYQAIRLALLAGLYLYVVNEIKGLGEIVLPVAIQVFIQGVVGVAQVLHQHSLGLNFLDELELDPAWNGVSIVWAEGIRSLRAYGLTDHPNILGGCFAFALILIATWYVEAEPKWRAPLGSLFALGTLGLLLTFSRAAWVGLSGGVLLGVALLFKTRQSRALRDWFSLAVASFILLLPFVWQNASYLGARFNRQDSFTQVGAENRSIVERNTLNQAVNAIFAEHALAGVGLGALPLALRDQYPDFPFSYQPAHVVLLDVAAETGIFGALFYLMIMVWPWLMLWWNRSRLVLSPALVGISSVLLVLTIVGFFDYYTWLLAAGRLWQWLVWGLWGVVYQSSLKGAQNA